MKRSRSAPYPELPMDLVDASGLLGAFAGGLSIVLPFFFGLTAAMGAVLMGTVLLRRSDATQTALRPGLYPRYFLAFAVALAAWAVVAFHPVAVERFLGAILGIAGLPLWAIARRPRPFGGD